MLMLYWHNSMGVQFISACGATGLCLLLILTTQDLFGLMIYLANITPAAGIPGLGFPGCRDSSV